MMNNYLYTIRQEGIVQAVGTKYEGSNECNKITLDTSLPLVGRYPRTQFLYHSVMPMIWIVYYN